MALSFEEAMGTLKAMFEGFDNASLEAVLRANNGHMERTVDQLLTMDPAHMTAAAGAPSGPNAMTAGPAAPSGAPFGAVGAYDYGFQSGRGLPAAPQEPPAPAPQPPQPPVPPVMHGAAAPIRVPCTLPDDFLRVPGTRSSGGGSAGQSQLQRDELLAQMLQDELFLAELQQNDEFRGMFAPGHGDLSAREAAYGRAGGAARAPRAPSRSQRGGGSGRGMGSRGPGRFSRRSSASGGGGGGGSSEGPSMQERLSAMGSDMRQRMAAAYSRFRSGSTNSSSSSRGRSAEHVPLTQQDDDDDDEDEVVAWDSADGGSGAAARRHVLDRHVGAAGTEAEVEMHAVGRHGKKDD